MTFLTPSIIKLQVDGKTATEFSITTPTNGQLTLSDHSRSPLSISYEVIEKFQRMANGTARKYVVARKKNLSCGWTQLPSRKTLGGRNFIADGNADANSMKAFYERYCNDPMTMTLYHKRNAEASSYVETLKVFWTEFSYDVIKRYQNFDYWDANASFVEI
jgi:hypothetical protein